MKKHTLTIVVLLLWSSLIIAQDKLKFSTKQTRELWQICSVSFRNLNPGIRADTYYPVCDCYVDYIRNNYTPEQVKIGDNGSMGMTQEEYKELSQKLRDTCNPKKSNEENYT
tara:strand:+ start:178 stop:513 length:336 start_codon:yes stop_codon:yes gene_type:complete